MNKMKTFLIKNRVILISSATVFLMLLVMFINSGNWPFGTNTVATYDLSAQVVPLSQLFKDFFQGKATLFYTNRLGGGFSILGSLIYFAMSPFFILLIVCPRIDAFYWINIVFVLYLISMSLSMSFAMNKLLPKLNDVFKIMFSICYAFCGYVILNYTFIVWLNFMILLPVMFVAFKRLVENGKYLCFSTLTFFYIVSCFGVGAMSQCLFLCIYFLFVMLCIEKNKRKEVLVRLTLAMFVAVSFSLLFIIPPMLESGNTLRGTNLFDEMLRKTSDLYLEEKIMFVFLDVVSFVFTVLYFITCNKKDKFNLFLLITTLLVYFMLFTDIALMMFNFGVYYSYASRSSSLLTVLSVFIAGKFLNDKLNHEKKDENKFVKNQNDENNINSKELQLAEDNNSVKTENKSQQTENKVLENLANTKNDQQNLHVESNTLVDKSERNKNRKEEIVKSIQQITNKVKIIANNKYLKIITTIILVIGCIIMVPLICSDFNYVADNIRGLVHNSIGENLYAKLIDIITIICVAGAIVGLIGACKILSKKWFKILVFVVMTCQLILSASCVYGIAYDSETWTVRHDLVSECGPYDKVYDFTKNSTAYDDVYGYMIFTSLLNIDNATTMSDLGFFASTNTITMDGGNLFSYSLLGIDYVCSESIRTEDYYSLKNTEKYKVDKNRTNYVYLYEYEYSTTGAFLVDEMYMWNDDVSIFENQNNLAKTMGATKDIFEVYNLNDTGVFAGNEIIINRTNLYRHDDNGLWQASDNKSGMVNIYMDIDEPVIVYIAIDESSDKRMHNVSFNYERNQMYESSYCSEIYNTESEFKNPHAYFYVPANQLIDLSDFRIGVLKLKNFEEQMELIKQNQVEVEYTASGFKVKTNAEQEDKYLMVSNSYQDDFKATNNGKSTQVYSIGPHFVGVKLNVGANSINVEYHYPYLLATLLIAGMFITISIVLIILYKKKHKIFKWCEKAIVPLYLVYTAIFTLIFIVVPSGMSIAHIFLYK